ncbi:hypothetical protein JB92DRAFT_2835147, partial [Gautieria morchelliformis]
LVIGHTFAISERNRAVLVILGGLSLASIAAAGDTCVVDFGIQLSVMNGFFAIQDYVSLVFNTVVIGVMVKYTEWVAQIQQMSFTHVFLEQGLLCYSVIFVCGLADFAAKLGSGIRYRSVHPNGTTQPSIRTMSFHAVLQRTGDMIVEEFGDGDVGNQEDESADEPAHT